MLTIENLDKIVGKTFTPDLNWMVSKTWEDSDKYHFILDRYNNNFKIDFNCPIAWFYFGAWYASLPISI